MTSYSFRTGVGLSENEMLHRLAPHAVKFRWFMEKGYRPHTWQALFHTLSPSVDDRLCRYRHLIAGRRGGKTLSAAWEVLFYCLHPEQFHWDTRREVSERALWVQVLAKDNKVGRPSLLTFREVLTAAGLKKDVDYKENRGDLFFEFPNGTLVEWKTAADPQSLRGAGLDILWIDEASFIPASEAYDVIHPSLMQKEGSVICTTTPNGKNWYYHEFFKEGKKNYGDDIGSVEYRSIDNPYFPKRAWELEKRRMHPLLFKQEYEASFDSMVGKELAGEWLTNHFYTRDELRGEDGKLKKMTLFMGIDPAISLADDADRFAAALIGVTEDHMQVFLLEMWAGRIPFPEQVDLVRTWHIKYRPQLIGIEAQAYQAALVQQTMRLETLPPIVPMMAKGKKSERILSMSPLFRIGKVRVRADQSDFIEEWLNYDSELKNPNDDCLDAVEIALRTAGALLPMMPSEEILLGKSFEDDIREDLPGIWVPGRASDDHLGMEW